MVWHGIGRVKAHDHRHKRKKALLLIYAGPFALSPPGTRPLTQRNATQPNYRCCGTFCYTNPIADAERQIGKNEFD